MSCWLGVSPRPLTVIPFSSSPLSVLILLLLLCRSATLDAICTPLALNQGPLPIRSLALTPPGPCVERYACHVLLPAPAAWARLWHCRSAPASPPRSPPLPSPTPVSYTHLRAHETRHDLVC